LIHLPLLQPHRQSLENCVYCPKLSRAACPVSNVTASETLTPWGKMSLAFFAARGDVPLDAEHAAPAWACSSCYACRERCEHKNEVATVLADARAEAFGRGVAPAPARLAADRAGRIAAEYRDGIARLQPHPQSGDTALMIGCSYVRHHPDIARALVPLAERFVGPTRALGNCCGLPSYHAGDRASFHAALMRLGSETRGARRLVVVDPGCAALLSRHAPLGVELPEIVPFVDAVFGNMERVPPLALAGRTLFWSDPCQLGRGLGRYEEPRAILARMTGDAPRELARTRQHAECSGGGGLLPMTYPEVSRAMADERIAEHRARGGGTLVTGCAASLRRYRSRGHPAVDWVELLDEACRT
jgi:Fe-S oxidoreductase